MESVTGLIKVGQKQHMQDLRQGNVYCNTLQFFREVEGEADGMKDRFEGGEFVEQFEELAFRRGDKFVPVLRNGFAVWYKNNFNGNLFCSYFINIPVDELETEEVKRSGAFPLNIQSSISSFADSFVVIRDINEFNARLEKAVKANGDNLFHGPIDYVDYKSYKGEITPFKKEARYSNQNEFIHYVSRNAMSKSDSVTYNLGDLSDIVSDVVEIECLKTLTFFLSSCPLD